MLHEIGAGKEPDRYPGLLAPETMNLGSGKYWSFRHFFSQKILASIVSKANLGARKNHEGRETKAGGQ